LSLESEFDVPSDMWNESLSGSDKLVQCEGSAFWTKSYKGRRYSVGVDGPNLRECRSTPIVMTSQRSKKGKGKGKVKVNAATVTRESDYEAAIIEEGNIVLRFVVHIEEAGWVKWKDICHSKGSCEGNCVVSFLVYGEIVMERHLTLTLRKSWVPRQNAFRIGGRRVMFSVYDVSLFTTY